MMTAFVIALVQMTQLLYLKLSSFSQSLSAKKNAATLPCSSLCGSVLQCAAVPCSALQFVAVFFLLQFFDVFCSVVHLNAVYVRNFADLLHRIMVV